MHMLANSHWAQIQFSHSYSAPFNIFSQSFFLALAKETDFQYELNLDFEVLVIEDMLYVHC